ncbi:SDR family oxidoreductase [Candidatus Pacearchaeota archaeon]|nr:SDR family oxidoreductase [Candidatus Pacearchaeota archaeon]
MKKFRLDEKVAVVTGGLGLIGREISISLAQAGAKVLVLDIEIAKGEKFEKECKKEKLDVKFFRFDVTDIKALDNTISQLFNVEGPIFVWVNTAYPRTKDWGLDLGKVKSETWQNNVDMHMNSYCLMTKTIAELMKKSKIGGSIINFGSIYGVVAPDFEIYKGTGMNNEGTYAAIKGGIINFSRFAASYYGKYCIRVNCICPGGVFDNQNEEFLKNYEMKTPLKRMANPDEIASATLFLASDASSYMTGTTLMVDGGWTCI